MLRNSNECSDPSKAGLLYKFQVEFHFNRLTGKHIHKGIKKNVHEKIIIIIEGDNIP